MKFVTGMPRGRARRMSLVTGVAVAGLIALTLPASAHHADVSGWTSCSNGVHVVHWTITNSQSDMAMTIDTATAAIGATPYTVVGYTSPVGNSGSTNATSTVPGGVTGVIKATIHVSWPDHYSATSTAEVNIPQPCDTSETTTTTQATTTTTEHQCECTTSTTQPATTTTEVTTTTKHQCECTTTTTQPATTTTTAATTTTTTTAATTTTTAATTTTQATTTTAATTTTTQPVETTTSSTEVLGSTTLFTPTTKPATTTTLGEQGNTVPTTEASTTSTPIGTVNLPRTGGSVEFPVIFGGLCIAAGAALALRKRDAWSRS